ncbi:MAG: glycosyltransferase family 39 protein [Candidatus Margulisiibacteriota bacterium]
MSNQGFSLASLFFLLSIWVKLFGASEYALRLFSILIGIGSILIFYCLAKRFFEEQAGLLGTFLLAISPLAVMYSQEIRMYGFVLLLSILSSLYFWKLLDRKRSMIILGYLVFTTLLILTHVFASLLLFSQFLFLIFDYWKKRDKVRFQTIILSQILIVFLAFP